jgi:outer membrane lipoprotein-sorting protein
MKFIARSRILWLTLLLSLPLTGCLFRSRKVASPSTAHLQSATQDELIEHINSEANGVRTLNATVDIATTVGGEKKGQVTEYREIRGYILVRQPDMLRMIGLLPVIHSRAFDMVSDGSEFKLWVPPKNKFYIGRNNVVPPGASGLLALRPRIIYDSLLLEEIDPKNDIAVMESGVERVINPETRKPQRQPDYRLDVIRRGPKGWSLARKIYFSRANLQPNRQIIYGGEGNVTSDSRYSQWKQYGALWFPSIIQITRPAEEYQITLTVVKLTLNEPLTDEQFALTLPPGAQVEHLDGTRITSNDATQQ